MDYYKPKNLKEAYALKKKIPKSVYLAGGTILSWRGKPKADALIDLKDVGLKGVKVKKDSVEIEALLTLQEIIDRKIPLIASVAKVSTNRNIRNMATIGGNLAGNFFVSHLKPALLALNAKVTYFANGRKQRETLKSWLIKKEGILCSVSFKRNRNITFRETKVAASDFPAVFTVFGYEKQRQKVKNFSVAMSGLTGKVDFMEKLPETLDARKLNAFIQSKIKPVGDIKVSAEVKRRIVYDHIISILEELGRR